METDQEYLADIAATGEEGKKLIPKHEREQIEIERNLVAEIPQTFSDVRTLLEHATWIIDHGAMDDRP